MITQSTSGASHQAILADEHYETKNAAILLSLYLAPNQIPYEIAQDTGLRRDYCEPRLSKFKDYNLIRPVARKRNPETGRNASTLALMPEARDAITTCVNDGLDPLDAARALFLVAREQYEQELEQSARGLMVQINNR